MARDMSPRTPAVLLAFCTLVAIVGLPRLAPATPMAAPTRSSSAESSAIGPTALHLRFGVGAPSGMAGVELERGLTDWLMIAAAAGLGSAGDGQAALTVRLRHLTDSGAVGLGAGV